ncbi:MAG TPA: DUF3341 domain-containing protein [Kiritimatiellia bacterium]|nr:DUF3341 domain-containing protein [Kiritimatiellia bacterium]
MSSSPTNPIFGTVAEFADGETLLAAAHDVRKAGYTATDAFSPIPVHGLTDALGIRRSRLASLVFIGGLTGCLGALAFQYVVSVDFYPHVVSGRPLFSWQSFVPVTFELTILLSAFAAVFGMLIRNRLPEPYHPVFNTPNFDRATTDSFFLCVQATDPKYDAAAIKTLLEQAGAVAVTEVAKHADDPE